MPVVFDVEHGEYHVEHRDGGYSILYHCPWCGGVAPKSKRRSLFANVPTAEWRRLARLTAGLKTVEDALAALGEPTDEQRDGGLTVEMPVNENQPRRAEGYRTLTFSKLSDVANVVLADYGPKGIAFSFSAKYIGKAALSRSSRLRRSRPNRRPKTRRK